MPTISEATTPRYGPPPHIGTSIEAGGFVVTCLCRWVRWFASAADATAGRGAHEKKCKVSAGAVA